ncbi:helix-turn-helix domain-containing protein [Thermanaeromonas toyohensis]|nr:helix-turn-helix transcriptional regulator [Thermanaeromonas toyohensis]
MFREARKQAGLSREEAAARLHIGTRTLFAYESGQSVVPPEIVLKMAEVYNRPDLPANYCAKMCPIGQLIAHHFEKTNVATMVLGLLKELEDVEKVKSRLISIAADGQVDENERPEFQQIVKEVVELEREIGELKQFAARIGISLTSLMPKQKEKAALRAAL